MVDSFSLHAETRSETGKRVKWLRRKNFIPGVLYGHGITPRTVSVGKIPFVKLYRASGASSLVDLAIDEGQPVKVLIQDVQVDPLRGDVIHIDFREVRMDEKIETDIALRFVHEAPAVKELGGILVKNITHLKVRCLPSALVHEIPVSLALLKTFTDKIHVHNIPLPPDIEVLTPRDEIVALVEEPRTEAELKELEAAPLAKVEEVKVLTEEKKAEREKEKEAHE